MKIIQHYAQGGKHKANDLPCEDRTYYMCANNVSVIALADGAGGKRYTHAAKGAECVTKTICEFFCNNFDKFNDINDSDEMKNIFTAVCHHNLKIVAEKEGLDDISKLSSTLLVVAVKNKKAIVCHIGDGVIGKVTQNNTSVVSAPDNGEFANHTFFISNPAASEHLNIMKMPVDDVVSFFLMSDGTAEYVYDEDAAKFHDSARKMSLMALEENGEEKLAETIDKFMIGPDPTSDDCSFITMIFEEKVANFDVGLPKNSYEGEIEPPAVAETATVVTTTDAVNATVPQQVAVADDVNDFADKPVAKTNQKSKGINVNMLKIIALVISLLSVILLAYTIKTAVDFSKENKKSEDTHAVEKDTDERKDSDKADTHKNNNQNNKVDVDNKVDTSNKDDVVNNEDVDDKNDAEIIVDAGNKDGVVDKENAGNENDAENKSDVNNKLDINSSDDGTDSGNNDDANNNDNSLNDNSINTNDSIINENSGDTDQDVVADTVEE